MENLRRSIQSITHFFPLPVRDFGISILGNNCYHNLLIDVDFKSTECLKLAASKTLGLGIIAASSVVKIPQIIKLVKSGTASGLSLYSYLLETLSYLISLIYCIRQGIPFSTFGEAGLILFQNIIITCLILNYSGYVNTIAIFIATVATIAFAINQPNIVDLKILSYLQAAAGFLGVICKFPQIITIWSQGGTGQLSAFAVFNFFLGSLARVFTVLQEVDDKLILYCHLGGFFLNTLIAVQMIIYWNSPTRASKKVISKQRYTDSASPSPSLIPKTKSSSNRRRG